MTKYTFIIEHEKRKENRKAHETEAKPEKQVQPDATAEAQHPTPPSNEDTAKNEKEETKTPSQLENTNKSQGEEK